MKYKLNYEITKEDYSRVVYGDTDSCFVMLKTPSYRKFTEMSEYLSEVGKPLPEELEELESIKTKLMEEAFEEGKVLADTITDVLFKKPIKLEFEKVYYPLLLLSKKRYIGNYYGKNPYTVDFVEKKGIVLKRRDNPEIVKKVYQGVIDPILENGKRGVNMALQFLKSQLLDIMNNKIDINDLIITKSLSKDYGKERCVEPKCEKPASKKHKYKKYHCPMYPKCDFNDKDECVVLECGKLAGYCTPHSKDKECSSNNVYATENSPHIALCKKIRERDPGAAPVVNDRINYLFVELEDNPAAKLFEKAEDPEYAIKNNLNIDVLYYIENQLRKPISEVLGLLIEDPDTLFDDITLTYKNNKKEAIKLYRKKIKSTQSNNLMSYFEKIYK